MRHIRDEGGFVLRALLITLVVFALVGVAVYDVGAVYLARYRAENLAQQSVSAALSAYGNDQGHLEQVCVAARASVQAADPTARIPKKGCVVNPDPQVQSVTVIVKKDANTVVVQHISSLSKWAVASESSTGSLKSL